MTLLEENSFYNVNGDEISISNLVEQMINFYALKLEVGETRVTDFNEGSEIRNILETFAIGIYALLEEQHEESRIAFISTSYGGWLDKIGELPFINLPRSPGKEAEGIVKFSIPNALSENYVIPADTMLSCSEGELSFYTISDAILYAGDTTCEVVVQCLTTGEDGNVAAGTIDIIDDDTIDTELVTVTNEAALENGADYEEDDEYRQRILDNIRADGFGSIGYYKKLGEDVDGVHDVKLISDANYTRKVLVNGYEKPTPNTVLVDVLAAYSDLTKLVLDHKFTVDKTGYTTVPLTISLSVSAEIDTDDLKAVLGCYFDGGSVNSADFAGLNIDEAVTYDMIAGTMLLFENVVNVTGITSGGSSVTTITPGSNTVLKLGTVTFNQTVV